MGSLGSRVVVALSGGVDSAVAAARASAGRDAVAMTLRLHGAVERPSGGHGSCCAPEDIDDARGVARQLGLPFYVLSAEDRFERHVIAPFVDAYLRGETPLPCAACNVHLKFGHLLRRALALGARLATGHYARVARGPDGRYRLLRARDARRDQSYFLYGLSQEALAHVEFPVGELTKEEVRAEATRLSLRVAEKPDSQELCFVSGDYAAFVEARVTPPAPGPVVDGSGRRLGDHRGVHRYTVGQRRGLPVIGGRPTFVRRIDAARGEIEAAFDDELARDEIEVAQASWPAGPPPSPFEALVRVRHHHAGEVATVTPLEGARARVRFRTPVRAPAPGQAAVFYQGDETVGGGTILPC
ncbi:MAG TPA: tRNA 2-thiouridine(34) synthase MnmA [Myxococcales bacterium]|nr:tRNA 2-thiouridine(34) synthase MnmA [Myxococcales bacterium]